MTKKFLALTMVLVLAAGFAAVAAEHEDDRVLMGTWENELTLDPNASSNTFAGYESVLDVEYSMNGINYTSVSEFSLNGYEKQEFGVDSSVGLLDLTSTLNMSPSSADLRFWETGASMTLGGVSIGTSFYLQKHDWAYSSSNAYEADFWPEYSDATVPPSFGTPSSQTGSYVLPYTSGSSYSGATVNSFHDYGSGLELTFSGETPGGVSVDVTNTFGMMPTSDAESELDSELANQVETFIEGNFAVSSFDSDWSDVSAASVIRQIKSQAPLSSTYTDNEVLKVWLASKLDVGNYDNSLDGDYRSVSEIVDDWDAYAQDELDADSGSELSTGDLVDAPSDASADVRSAYVSALKGSLTISGVAGDTGKVVNTEFEVAGAQYDWTVTAGSGTTDASVAFGLEKADVGPGQYGGSSLQYYSTLIELDNLSIGCCDFSNETKFTELDGFQYTEFDFSMTMETFPIDVAATLKWDNDPDTSDTGKVVTLTPSLSTDWSCFTVYTDLGSADGDIDSISIDGFEISAELGHVEVTSVTALGSNDLTDLSTSGSYHGFDEVLRIDKLESAGDLDFVLDYYTNMGSSGNGLMPVAIEGSASYPISSQFDLGTNLAWVDYSTYSGLQEVGLTFDYSF